MEDKSEIISEMQSLVREHRLTCQIAEGLGEYGQQQIETVMEEIDEFIRNHPDVPELKKIRPAPAYLPK